MTSEGMAWVVCSIVAAAAIVAAFLARRAIGSLGRHVASAREGSPIPPGRWPLAGLASRIESLRQELSGRAAGARRDREIYLAILNGLGEGVIAVDRNRRVVLANARAVRLFGIEPPAIGRPLSDLLRVSAVFAAIDDALEGNESAATFDIRSTAGERMIEMRALPLPLEEIAAVSLFIDVTQIQKLERIRGDFISDFSHEVRTPLAGLRSAVETFDTAAGQLSRDEERQLRRIMIRQLARLERLAGDLAELSRIETGEVHLDRRDIDLLQLVEELREDFAERAALDRTRLLVEGAPAVVWADPLRIEQALSNLIDNALKYGGGKDVRISVSDTSDTGIVRIVDQGEGIPASEHEKIFRRFYRGDPSRSQEIGGSGLGLAITKHLVLRHGGTVTVDSEPGKGAAFTVTLPKRTN